MIARRLPALASPGYRRFLAAALLASTGGWLQGTAQGWLVLTITDSPAALGLVSALQGLPILLFSLVAGVVADGVDRRRLLVAMQVCGALVAFLLALLTTAGVVTLWQIALLAFVGGTLQAFQSPAYQAIVASLVEREAIGSAVALNAAQFNLSRILGPSIAGVVIAGGSLVLAFWANALILLVVVGLLVTITVVPGPAGRAGASLRMNLAAGLRYVAARRLVAALVLLSGAPALLLLNYLVLLPVYARDVLGIGAPGLGLLSAGVGIGALTGAIALAILRPGGGSGRLVVTALVVASVAEIVFAVSRATALSVAALTVLGFCQVLYYATTNTLLQVLVPARLRGRVMGLYILVSWGLMPLGSVAAGALAEILSPETTLLGGAVATIAAALLTALVVPELRRVRAGAATAAAPA